jgi:hypothetical protein
LVRQDEVVAAPLVGRGHLGWPIAALRLASCYEKLFAQALPLDGETMVTNPEMWGRDIEACRQLRSSMLTLRIRHADELSRFPRSNLILNMLDQVVDAVQFTIEDAEERLLERLQAKGQLREGPSRSVGTLDPSRLDKP